MSQNNNDTLNRIQSKIRTLKEALDKANLEEDNVWKTIHIRYVKLKIWTAKKELQRYLDTLNQ